MMKSISQSISAYLDSVHLARSESTAKTYKNALNRFSKTLKGRKLPVDQISVDNLTEDAVVWFAADLKGYSPATERLYLTAVTGFYEYLAAEELSNINLPRLRLLIKQRARRPGTRLPQFPRESIEHVLIYLDELIMKPVENKSERYRHLRDRAFLLTLALRRGDLDWNEGKAIVIGKGDREAVVRFSNRSIRALKEYLSTRAELDGNSGRALTSLPLFARHDKGAGKKVKPITTTTGRNIVAKRVRECLGKDAVGSITPHSFRHYFVTTVLRGSGGNLKLAQELARHKNIAVTTRYAHLADDELDEGYFNIFEQKNEKE